MNASNLESFNKTVAIAAAQMPNVDILVLQRKLAIDGLAKLTEKTPVDTGRARSNWQLTINTPAEGELKTDQATEASKLASLGPFQEVWISNNVPYIEALEHGHSKQAPEGMLMLTLEELKAQFNV